jgi:hypothetical protein
MFRKIYLKVRDWFRSFKYWKLEIIPGSPIWLSKKNCQLGISADEMVCAGSLIRQTRQERKDADWWYLVKK